MCENVPLRSEGFQHPDIQVILDRRNGGMCLISAKLLPIDGLLFPCLLILGRKHGPNLPHAEKFRRSAGSLARTSWNSRCVLPQSVSIAVTGWSKYWYRYARAPLNR